MAEQNITELPVKTSSGITSSDYMLGIDSAEGYQMLIRDLGDYIIRNVQVNTIAGANQTLKAALDTLNSNTYLTIGGREITANGDLNTDAYCVEGTYHCNSADIARSLQNCPTTTVFRMIAESTSSGASANYKYIRRTIITGTSASNYKVYTQFCYKIGTGASFTFGSWTLEPSRSEVDALSSKVIFVSKTLTIPAGTTSSPSTTDVDFTKDIPSGSIYGLFASAGATPLPYVNNSGQVQTWLRSVGAKTARIYETGTGYSSRDWYFVLFIH